MKLVGGSNSVGTNLADSDTLLLRNGAASPVYHATACGADAIVLMVLPGPPVR
jgi:hypothetical protein